MNVDKPFLWEQDLKCVNEMQFAVWDLLFINHLFESQEYSRAVLRIMPYHARLSAECITLDSQGPENSLTEKLPKGTRAGHVVRVLRG